MPAAHQKYDCRLQAYILHSDLEKTQYSCNAQEKYGQYQRISPPEPHARHSAQCRVFAPTGRGMI